MKVNKWTMGLAAVGLVSLPSLVQAEEKASPVMTALSSTTLSGFVDTSMQWDMGTGNVNSPPFAFNAIKQDGFNLNVVQIILDKPMDEGQWASGYHIDLALGPDGPAVTGGGPIKQAYVALRAPVGNGIDFKLGRWDTIIGYETFSSANNPNYTRSYGYTVEPTEHTGLLATYQINKQIGISGGIANTLTTLATNFKSTRSESAKAYMASVALTAPDDWGAVAGSVLYGGFITGFGSATENQDNYYVGATINTPVKNLKAGASFDYVNNPGGVTTIPSTVVWAAYTSYQATEKMSIHGRFEYAEAFTGGAIVNRDILEATVTLQYDLWKNVLSRLEFRWDHAADGAGPMFGGTLTSPAPNKVNNYMLVANVVYKF